MKVTYILKCTPDKGFAFERHVYLCKGTPRTYSSKEWGESFCHTCTGEKKDARKFRTIEEAVRVMLDLKEHSFTFYIAEYESENKVVFEQSKI